MKYALILAIPLLTCFEVSHALEKRKMIETVLVAIDSQQVAADYTNRLFDELASDGSFSDREEKKVRTSLDFSGYVSEAGRFFEAELSDDDVLALYDYYADPVNASLYRSLAATESHPEEWDRVKKETEQVDPERWSHAERFYRSTVSRRFHAAQKRFTPLLKEYARKTLMRAIEASINP